MRGAFIAIKVTNQTWLNSVHLRLSSGLSILAFFFFLKKQFTVHLALKGVLFVPEDKKARKGVTFMCHVYTDCRRHLGASSSQVGMHEFVNEYESARESVSLLSLQVADQKSFVS